MEREKHGKEHRDNGTKREERYREMQRDKTDGMGQMERGHTSEVQPTDVTREYVRGDFPEAHRNQRSSIYGNTDDTAWRTGRERWDVPHGKSACG